jgi:hypothetical protein
MWRKFTRYRCLSGAALVHPTAWFSRNRFRAPGWSGGIQEFIDYVLSRQDFQTTIDNSSRAGVSISYKWYEMNPKWAFARGAAFDSFGISKWVGCPPACHAFSLLFVDSECSRRGHRFFHTICPMSFNHFFFVYKFRHLWHRKFGMEPAY